MTDPRLTAPPRRGRVAGKPRATPEPPRIPRMAPTAVLDSAPPLSGPAGSPPPGVRPRLDSVDLLRGVIIVLMALDHTRDFFGDLAASPTNLATATPALFMTRWVTHFCAPVFFLLTGTGAYLALRRKTPRELSRFLLTRGLWLLLLEVVIVRCLGWQWNFDFRLTMLTVLWALGWAMILLAGLVRLGPKLAGVFGVLLIAGHNLFDGVKAAQLGALAPLWTLLHAPGIVHAGPVHTVFAAYVLVPWVGVTAAGYALGMVYDLPAERRRPLLRRLGAGMIGGFLLLRAVNLYGDPAPWSVQGSRLYSVLSFINTTKYPPSLLYLLMTLGPALLFLAWAERGTPRALSPALTIGRVPMFFYLAHVVLIHTLALIACAVRFGGVHWMFESPTLDRFPITQPPEWPAPLPVVWGIWVLVVILLYPLCRWFAALKQRRRDAWLSYI